MKKTSIILISLAFLSQAQAKTFLPRSKVKTVFLDKQLSIRGGAGPVSADTAANLLGGYCLVEGAVLSLAPQLYMESLGATEEYAADAESQRWTRAQGHSFLGIGLVFLALHMMDWKDNTAHALMCVPWCAEWLHSLLTQDKMVATWANILGLLLYFATLYGNLADTEWRLIPTKLLYSYAMFCGVTCGFLNVKTVEKIWTLPERERGVNDASNIRGLGYLALLWGVMGYTLLFDEKDILVAGMRMCVTASLLELKYLFLKEYPNDTVRNYMLFNLALSLFWAYSFLETKSSGTPNSGAV
jgi:hypothetical protein